MTFPEIFDKFKNHYYIRRQSWSENVFAQYRYTDHRYTAPLIRLVKVGIDSIEDSRESANTLKTVHILDNDVRFTAEDLLANDWVIYELI